VVGCFVHNRLVGVARYKALTDPAEAEIVLVVDVRTRTLGVATSLLEQLVTSAEHEGVRRFIADGRVENSTMLSVFVAPGVPIRAARSASRHPVVH